MNESTLIIRTQVYFRDLLKHLYDHGGDFEQASLDARKAGLAAGISEDELRRIVLLKWRELADSAFDDHILSELEEERLRGISDAFLLTNDDLNQGDYLTKFIKTAILRDLKNGTPKTRFSLDVPLPFKLQPREVMLWAFPNTRLFERVTKREVRGGSTGASIRLMKGLYWRLGAFKGVPVSWEETKHTGTGLMVLTSKHILFSSSNKNWRIPFSKLASIEPYSDAIEIQRDAATARPQMFRDIDGQFAYNLIQVA